MEKDANGIFISEGNVVEYFTLEDKTTLVKKDTANCIKHYGVCYKNLNSTELRINKSIHTNGAFLSQISEWCYVVGNINQPHLRKHFDKEFLDSIGTIN